MPVPTTITNEMLRDADHFVTATRGKRYSEGGLPAEVVGAVWYTIDEKPVMHVQLHSVSGARFVIPVSEFENNWAATK